MHTRNRGEVVKVAKETGSARAYAGLREEILRMSWLPGAPLDEVKSQRAFRPVPLPHSRGVGAAVERGAGRHAA